MWRVAARRHISDGNQGAERIIIKRVRGKKVLVLVVTSGSPEVTNLLGLDASVDRMRRASQRRSRDLKDGQRRSILCQRLSHTWNGGN